MIRADVTDLVRVGSIEDEDLVLLRCVCGELFDAWDMLLHPEPRKMRCCGALLSFTAKITVYESRKEK